MDFMGPPRDWLEGFIRHFRITEHTHLENGEEREVLPWLKLAIELDPQAIQTYTDTAFWLRKTLGNVQDAEEVLREPVDAFFDGVMVNAEQMDVRLNRQALLKMLHQAMNRVADLSRLAV